MIHPEIGVFVLGRYASRSAITVGKEHRLGWGFVGGGRRGWLGYP